MHLDAFVHDLVLAVLDGVKISHCLDQSLNLRVVSGLTCVSALWDHASEFGPRFGQKLESFQVSLVLVFDLFVGLLGHIHLCSPVGNLLLVSPVDGSAGHPAEFGAVLGFESCIFGLFFS